VNDPEEHGPRSAALSEAEDEWRRHPSDVARLVLAGLVLGGLLVLARFDAEALRDPSADLLRAVGRLPSVVRDLFIGLAQVAALVAPVVLVLVAGWRRVREIGLMVVAGVVAAGCMALVTGWLDRVVPPKLLETVSDDAWLADASFPSATYLAAFAAAVTVISPTLPRAWQRIAWASLGLAALVRLLSATQVPVNLAVTISLGVLVGSAVLVAFGAPVRRPGAGILDEALQRMGLKVEGLTEVPGRAARTFSGTLPDGTVVRIDCIGRDERDEDVLYRAWRLVRVKGLADEAPGWSPLRHAQHEALVSLMARDGGARVPRVLGMAEASDRETVVVFEATDGRPLADLDADEVTDDLLHQVWLQVGLLHERRIAHRQLDAGHVIVGPEGAVTLVDLDSGQISARREQLGADVAELLVSTALTVGADRAVAAAVVDVDHDDLVAALPLVQPLALSERTRKAAKQQKGLLGGVASALASAIGEDEVQLAEIQRLTVGKLMSGVGFIVLLLFGVGLASNWSDIVGSFSGADWAYVPWIFLAMVLTFVFRAVSLVG